MDGPRAQDDWYRSAFGPLTVAFWGRVVSEERVEQEARFLAEALAAPGGLLLDVPCGSGRHARALARRGHRVEGVDLSAHMLAAAAPADGVTLRQGDMAALDAAGRYHGAFCWGNSFGYLPDGESRAFLRAVARALRPGARFALDAAAVAEHVLSVFQPRTEVALDGFRFTADRRYDLGESAIHTRYRVERDGAVEEFVARQCLYTAAELLRMAADAGLAVESLHGGAAGEPAALGRPLIAVFRRAGAP